jgi:hypothetical protein
VGFAEYLIDGLLRAAFVHLRTTGAGHADGTDDLALGLQRQTAAQQ